MSDIRRLAYAERELPAPAVLLLGFCCLLPFALLFAFWTASSPLAFPQFVIAVVLLIYVPGKSLLDCTKANLRPLEEFTLSLVLGMTVSSLVYWIAAFIGLWHLFLLWPAAALAVLVYRRRRAWRDIWRTRIRLEMSHLLLCLVIAVLLVPLALLPMYYRNGASLPQGGMTFLSKPRDVIFHLSIAQELRHSIPPEVPYLAGLPLGYHYGMDLLNAMLSNAGRLSVLDSSLRFTPTLLLTMTALAVFCFSRVWLRSGYGAALSAFLVMMGEDFSFVPGLLSGSKELWSVQYFDAPTTFSLYFLNPMLPAVAILFSGLFCLAKFVEERTGRWLVLTAFLFAIAMEYKIFVTGQVLFAVAVSAAVYLFLFRDKRLLMVAVATGLAVAPFLLYSFLGTEAGSRVWVRLAPWPYVPQTLEQLGLGHTWLSREVGGLYAGSLSLAGFVTLCVIALPIYFAGSLGFRVLALPAMLRGILAPSPSTILRFFLALMVLAGAVMALTLSVTPLGYPVETEYNQSIWFYVLSKYVATVLAVELVLAVCRRWRPRYQALLVCAVIVLSVPSAIQFLESQTSYELDLVSASEVELASFLDRRCTDGDVVLSRQVVGTLVAALTQCRVPVLNISDYTHSFISLAELNERKDGRSTFWSDWDGGELRDDILKRYGVHYVVVDRRAGDQALQEAASVGTGLEGASGAVTLYPVLDNGRFVVYEVQCDDEPTP